MKISVFGGSQPQPGSDGYQQAMELGRLLAEKRHIVLTGGYIGTMEAVSRGAHEAGGHVIGVTCTEIERWRSIGANRWVKEEWKRESLIQRLEALITNCDAAFALPGGPGTLAEISLMWNLMIIGSLDRRPLILIGEGWQQILSTFFEQLGNYSPPNQRDLLHFAPDPVAAVAMLPG